MGGRSAEFCTAVQPMLGAVRVAGYGTHLEAVEVKGGASVPCTAARPMMRTIRVAGNGTHLEAVVLDGGGPQLYRGASNVAGCARGRMGPIQLGSSLMPGPRTSVLQPTQ